MTRMRLLKADTVLTLAKLDNLFILYKFMHVSKRIHIAMKWPITHPTMSFKYRKSALECLPTCQ